MGTQLNLLDINKTKSSGIGNGGCLNVLPKMPFNLSSYLSFPLHKIIQPMLGRDTKGCPRT
jgi:hypothetical protein